MSENQSAESLKRGYSREELENLYALGHFYLENGQWSEAESIMLGLCDVAPELALGWLGLGYVNFMNGRMDEALKSARAAQRAEPSSPEAQLMIITCLINMGDFNTAGSMLGEIGDRVAAQEITNPSLVRYFRAQLSRYENRS